MVFVACAIAVLSLVSVSHAAPLSCEDLLRPLDQVNLEDLQGIRALVAGSISFLPYLNLFGQRDSATINFSRNTSDSGISYTRSLRVEKCEYSNYNISLEGSSFFYDGRSRNNFTASLINTCDDCVLMLMTVNSGLRQHFYLFSRRRALENAEMEKFRDQVACLDMPEPVVMDPTKELCPEQTPNEEES